MIGLDTNVVVRLLVEDDPIQCAQARMLIAQAAQSELLFISLATIIESVWVMRSRFQVPALLIAAGIEALLSRLDVELEAAEQVFSATVAFKKGIASFEDALIGELGRRAGCTTTYTFDRKAARLATFTLLAAE